MQSVQGAEGRRRSPAKKSEQGSQAGGRGARRAEVSDAAEVS